MNNPAWILEHLAPVVVAYAETLPDGRLHGDFYGVHYWVESYECRSANDRYFLNWLGKELTTRSNQRHYCPFRVYCLDTIPRHTPTWHAFLLFLRYYG